MKTCLCLTLTTDLVLRNLHPSVSDSTRLSFLVPWSVSHLDLTLLPRSLHLVCDRNKSSFCNGPTFLFLSLDSWLFKVLSQFYFH